MSQQELLKTVIKGFNEINIDYMVTGSIVSSLQGEPRLTHDIDIVVSIQESDVPSLLNYFSSPKYYLSEPGIKRAMSNNTMFNLIDVKYGDKVDFWILTDTPFDRIRFSRKILETIIGIEMYISTPEDTILAKLRWLKLSNGSEKQFKDALRIYEIQYHNLNLKYIEKWAKKLEVKEHWKKIKQEAKII